MSGSVIKQWNPATSQWEPVLVGKQGPIGPTGPTGPQGVVSSATAPANTSLVWIDTAAPNISSAPSNATYVTLSSNGTLENERVLTAGSGIELVDGGSGSAATIKSFVPGGAARPLLTGGAYLDGINGLVNASGLANNGASTPDSVAVSITGDIDISVRMRRATWSVANQQLVVTKGGPTAVSYSLGFSGFGGKTLEFFASQNGTSYAINGVDSSVGVPFADGESGWIRATLDIDNGTGSYELKFYTAVDSVNEPLSWTQLGTTRTGTALTGIFDSTQNLTLGQDERGGAYTLSRVIIKNGINGTLAFDSDFSTQTADALAFNAQSGTGIKANGLVLAGRVGEYATSPDSTALDITGDIDIRAQVALTDWTPGNDRYIVSKWSSGNLSYIFHVNSTGLLRFIWTTNGSTQLFAASTVAPSFVDGSMQWIRVTMDVDNGASNAIITFYTSTDGTVWTQLGNTVANGSTTSIFSGTAPLTIGGPGSGSGGEVSGTVSRIQIYNGINGTLAFDANFDAQVPETVSFTESSANAATVTVVGCYPPVTINTTRYTIGLPNTSYTSVSSQGLSANNDYWEWFLVTDTVIVDAVFFEVATTPASNSIVHIGLYAADNNFNPTGAPLANFGPITVNNGQTGVFSKQISPITLNPGAYILGLNNSVAITYRNIRSVNSFATTQMGANPLLRYFSNGRTTAVFPNTPPVPSERSVSTIGAEHFCFLRWRKA